MSIAKFSVKVGPTGRGEVVVNDVDVSKFVRRLELKSVASELTTMVLEFISEVEVEGEGVVVVQAQDTATQEMLALLEDLDPQILDKMILDRFGGFGGPSSTASAFLTILKEVILGYDDGARPGAREATD